MSQQNYVAAQENQCSLEMEAVNRKAESVDSITTSTLVEIAYDPHLTQECGKILVDALSDHLGSIQKGDGPVQRWRNPEDNIAHASRILDNAEFSGVDDLVENFSELLQLSLKHGQNLNHPCCVGHQVPAPLPLVGLFDAVTTMTNQVQGVYEMGPWGIAAERAVIDLIAEKMGFTPGRFGGLVTSGGSLGNLTALLAARNEACPWIWNHGTHSENMHEPGATVKSETCCDAGEGISSAHCGDGQSGTFDAESIMSSHGKSPVLVVHGDAHYCVDRAAGVMGIGQANVLRVPLDENRQMDVAALDALLGKLREKKVPVIAVVAVACTTAIGAFDPIEPIADVCEHHQVWLHVDAAHGGAVCLSRQHRHLVQGLQRADSVVVDAHKMMFVPAVCAIVIYRNKKNRFRAFEQSAPYLFDPSAPDMSEYDNGVVTFECTKRSATLGLWASLSMFGLELFEQLVDRVFLVARQFHDALAETPEFEVFSKPQANIVVFRYMPEAVEAATLKDSDGLRLKLSRLQLRMRRRILESGFGYLTQTTLNGEVYLRCTIMNPLTDLEHLETIVGELKRIGPRLWDELATTENDGSSDD